MSDLISYLVDRVAALAAKVEGIATRQWGVVTSADPLLVRLDGDPAPLVGTPDTLVGGLAVGDRVRVSIENRRPIIIGRAGGPDIVRVIGDTGWVSVVYSSGWTGSAAVRRIGTVVYASGYIRPASGNMSTGLKSGIATVPAGFRPGWNLEAGIIGRISGDNDTLARLAVATTGSVDVAAQAVCNHVRVDGVCWPTG